MLDVTLRQERRAAHHEMEWFLSTLEGTLRYTYMSLGRKHPNRRSSSAYEGKRRQLENAGRRL